MVLLYDCRLADDTGPPLRLLSVLLPASPCWDAAPLASGSCHAWEVLAACLLANAVLLLASPRMGLAAVASRNPRSWGASAALASAAEALLPASPGWRIPAAADLGFSLPREADPRGRDRSPLLPEGEALPEAAAPPLRLSSLAAGFVAGTGAPGEPRGVSCSRARCTALIGALGRALRWEAGASSSCCSLGGRSA